MQIAKVQLARSIWLFDVQELNPLGINTVELLAKTNECYGFRNVTTPDDVANKKTRLTDGRFFWMDGATIVDVALEIYNDGLVADTRSSTDASNAFLKHFIDWLALEVGVIYSPQMTRRRSFRSEIVFFAEHGLAGLCTSLSEFAGLVAERMRGPSEFTGVVFGSESRQQEFVIERKVGEPFESNKFYSSAQMTTTDHIQLLSDFERLLLQSRGLTNPEQTSLPSA